MAISDIQLQPGMTVYSASAGSGKTYTLAGAYIGLLMQNPESFREILAVTFTVKATAEMKMRIMRELYELGWLSPGDPRASNAQEALKMMLEEYHNINIVTIDAFFQKVLRNLAHELELPNTLRVELNEDEVLQMAVDRLFSDLRDTGGGDQQPLEWIRQFINITTEEEGTRNVVRSIREFGGQVFRDEYKMYREALVETFSDPTFFDDYVQRMKRIVSKEEGKLASRIAEFDQEMRAHAGEKGLSTVESYFKKLRAVDNGNYDIDNIFNKTLKKAVDARNKWWVDILGNTEECRSRIVKRGCLYTARMVLDQLSQLRLLSAVANKMEAVNAEVGQVLLGQTQHLLRDMMEGEVPASFIFEKMGARIKHTMIDEFQDTSTIQWQNFKPLLLESLAQAGKNMIVGDVKQSIYRWRSGDWGLLHNIGSDPDLKGKALHFKQLDRNWRSERRIIEFNNDFFLRASELERQRLVDEGVPEDDARQIVEIYKTVAQKPSPAKEDQAPRGYVEVCLLPKKKEGDDGYDFREESNNKVKSIILDLLEHGEAPEDIAIISRNNSDLSALAVWLTAQIPGVSFVSNEAYSLESSQAVNIMVLAIRLIAQGRPDDSSMHRVALMSAVGEERFRDFEKEFQTLRTLPLNELAEALVTLLGVNTMGNEAAYINYFIDQMNAMARKNIPDCITFVEMWDKSLHKKSVPGGSLKGVQMMTIHKSKGLEFKHVIVTDCDWNLEGRQGSVLWCRVDPDNPRHEPFLGLPVMQVNSREAKRTIFREEHLQERLQNAVDNLNLLYVAFTRAGMNLFVIGQDPATKTADEDSNKRSTLVKRVLGGQTEYTSGDGPCYSAPQPATPQAASPQPATPQPANPQASRNVFDQPSQHVSVTWDVAVPRALSPAIFQPSQARLFDTDVPQYIQNGTDMHGLLSLIRTPRDLGKLRNEEARRFLWRRIVDNRKNPGVARWFGDGVEVLTECSIAERVGDRCEVRRPDRVVVDRQTGLVTVIDYKFASRSKAVESGRAAEYAQQVSGYMSLLRRMGHHDVEGYLWYVYENELCRVS